MTQSSDVRGGTISTVKAGLTAGATTSTYTTAAATTCSIGGKMATTLAAQTNAATPTTDGNGAAFTALAASQGCILVFTVNAAGTLKVFQGPSEALDAANDFESACDFPYIDLSTYAPFAYVVVKNSAAGSAWTFGTSNWSATGLTDTYTDVTTLPLRPQIL